MPALTEASFAATAGQAAAQSPSQLDLGGFGVSLSNR